MEVDEEEEKEAAPLHLDFHKSITQN